MQAAIRQYSGKGAKELFDVLEKNLPEIERTMRSVAGFASYTLARTGDGGFSVTVCQDAAGIADSVQKARDWIEKNAGNLGVGAPTVTSGQVVVHVK